MGELKPSFGDVVENGYASEDNPTRLSLYRALRTLNPSPYMYYYHLDDAQVVGSSPEILVRQVIDRHGGHVTILDAPGGGALIRVEFPLHPGVTSAPPLEH